MLWGGGGLGIFKIIILAGLKEAGAALQIPESLQEGYTEVTELSFWVDGEEECLNGFFGLH